MRPLADRPARTSTPVPTAVAELAKLKNLHDDWLAADLGLRAGPIPGSVLIPYRDVDGALLFERQRNPPGHEPRFVQPKGTKLRPYGLWLLDQARKEQALVLAEGESDSWACWAAGAPALGLPGEGNAGVLEAGHLEGIDHVYLAFDNQKLAGEDGSVRYVYAGGEEKPVVRALKRLAELEYKGHVYRLRPPPVVKDLSDWRAGDPAAFQAQLAERISQAEELTLPPKRVPPPPRPPSTLKPDADALEKYVAKALEDECAKVAESRDGGRNNQLNASAFALGQFVGAGGLSHDEAAERLADAAEACGLSDWRAGATIRSGLGAGVKKPRDLSDVGAREGGSPSSSVKYGSAPPPAPSGARPSSGQLQIDGAGAGHEGEPPALPLQAAQPAPQQGGHRPTIVITTEETEVNDQAIKALAANEPGLYRRGGALVRVLRDGKASASLSRPAGAPRIVPVEEPTLQEMMARAALWVTKGAQGDERRSHPPRWSVQQVLRRGDWEGVRHLAGVVEAPTLRADGTVLEQAGYDEATGLLYEPSSPFPAVQDEPTVADADRAAEALLDLVSDFPFAGDAHKAAWLAALLTVFARPAVDGPCPLFLFEAPGPGAGKTLLAELIGLIATGRELPASELPTEDDEVRKAITAILLEGERIVLFDNAADRIGCPALDAVLTKTMWKGRVLGRSQRTPDLPAETVWLATGNNLRLKGDTHRRVVPCRLEPAVERPEERSGFKYPDLKAHARARRPELVAHALTILKAHALAGRPRANLSEFGSYEGWSRVVRQAVFWVMPHDPCAARLDIQPDSRGDAATLGAVLEGWAGLPGGDGRPGLAARKALEAAREPGRHQPLRDALAEWGHKGELPDARSLGYKLRAARGRVVGGLMLQSATEPHSKTATWFVTRVAEAGDAGDVPGGPDGRGG